MSLIKAYIYSMEGVQLQKGTKVNMHS